MATRGGRSVGARVHRRGRSLNSRVLQLGALALSFITISVLVVTSSRAAFVAQSDNVTNQVSSASISLSDNDNGVAMFTSVGNLVPGQVVDRCIDVTYTGAVDPTAVKLFISGPPTGTLGTYLDLQVDQMADTADAYGSCTIFNAGTPTNVYTGTLAGFAGAHTDHTTGLTTWDPGTGPETRTFRFRISVQDDANAPGKSSNFGFTWETRTS